MKLFVVVFTLTHKVLHHGRIVMRRRSQTQQLLTTRNSGVVDGLHVDVVSLHHDVTHPGVQFSIAHLLKWTNEMCRLPCGAIYCIVVHLNF